MQSTTMTDRLFSARFAFNSARIFYTCTVYVYVIYFISDTQQDKEKDKYEAEYMLEENGKAMYE